MSDWKLETVKTSCGCCHKIGPLEGGRKDSFACVYDDGNPPQRPNAELLRQAKMLAASQDLLKACKTALTAISHSADITTGNRLGWAMQELDAAITKAEAA